MEKVVGIHRKRPLPRYQFLTFERWFKRHRSVAPPLGEGRVGAGKRTVAYFYGCWVNYNERRLGEMVIHVLERNGVEVILPRQQCCGIPAVVNSNIDLARKYGTENVNRWGQLPANVDIIASSTSCGLMLKHDYSHLLDIPGAERVGPRTYDICEYLWMMYENGELDVNFEPVETRLLYHAPCHLKSHGIGYPATRLLHLIPGVQLEEVDEGCCGISGTFGVKVEKYDLSMKIGSRLFASVKAAGSDSVLADCETCRMQVEHGSGAHSAHPIEILAKAYGYR
jgi:glycerol-3-phosphate dehydrogenase subunit C